MYYSARLHRKYGVPFESYTITDAPSQSERAEHPGGGGHPLPERGREPDAGPLFKQEITRKRRSGGGAGRGEGCSRGLRGYSQAGRSG